MLANLPPKVVTNVLLTQRLIILGPFFQSPYGLRLDIFRCWFAVRPTQDRGGGQGAPLMGREISNHLGR